MSRTREISNNTQRNATKMARFTRADEHSRGKGGLEARERKKPLKREERSRKLKSLGERSCYV